jgi:hypothetical protein
LKHFGTKSGSTHFLAMKKGLPVRWDLEARENLNDIYDFIAEDSESAARYVVEITYQP